MSKVQKAKLGDLKPDEHNPNRGTERGAEAIRNSLEELGAGRSILIGKDGQIIAGNKTVEQALGLGFEEVLIIETDGRQLVAVKRPDLDDAQARKMAYADNRAGQLSLEWDAEELKLDLEAGLDLGDLFESDELDALLDLSDTEHTDSADSPSSEEALSALDVPDALWPSDNDLGIPMLRADLQADAVDLPVSLWGAVKRNRKMRGTWAFYVDDYRFEALWRDPSSVINTGCATVIEPNFTVGPQTPKAVAIWQIYRKRWLARYWQSKGLRVFVDLNINLDLFGDIALLGVPLGWAAYATRGYSDRLAWTIYEYQAAQEHANTEHPLFLVYGGGSEVKEAAQRFGWVWIPEHMDQKRDGVILGAGSGKNRR